jgi:hypothetical protein
VTLGRTPWCRGHARRDAIACYCRFKGGTPEDWTSLRRSSQDDRCCTAAATAAAAYARSSGRSQFIRDDGMGFATKLVRGAGGDHDHLGLVEMRECALA